ncbi:hypothetical protein NE237_001301 [Protea cynaroides]|uniref:Methyltransferase type 11 domain-containing protein n=1 Tax=Protea cynaroides TaxID=273540 RepID=A0A9Q0QXY3_9MAGN|nr:hypothetical protein NE237_001301 [Protea cynaroides]
MAVELFKLQLIYHNLAFKKSSLVKLFLLAIAMASIPCFNLLIPLDGCDPSWAIETAKVRLNASDLDAAFKELMTANWLINGYETLSIGRDAARAVMVLNKLGFPDAMGLYKSCSSLFEHRHRRRALPFNEGSFDFVVSTEMIDGVRVPARLVLEMERVLRPSRVGVVMRRVNGNFPVTAVMKAAAPVAAFLRFSEVVAVRTVNCTVVVVFKKRTMVRQEKPKAMIPSDVITKKPRDSAKYYVGIHAPLKKKTETDLSVSVTVKSTSHPITKMPRDSATNNVGALGTEKKKVNSTGPTGVLITEKPRKSAVNYGTAYATLKKRVLALSVGDTSLITQMPRGSVGSLKNRYPLKMPSFGTKKRYGNGG